jgi:hypothetical protein
MQNHKELILNTGIGTFKINVSQRIIQQIMPCRLDTTKGFYDQNITNCSGNELAIRISLWMIRSEDEKLRKKRTLFHEDQNRNRYFIFIYK